MKRSRIFSIILVSVAFLCMMSCDLFKPKESNHNHSYDSTTLVCSCGAKKNGFVAYIGESEKRATARFMTLQDAVDYLENKTGKRAISTDNTIHGYGSSINSDGVTISTNIEIKFDFTGTTVNFTGTEGIVVSNGSIEIEGLSLNCSNTVTTLITVTGGNVSTNINFTGSVAVEGDGGFSTSGGTIVLTGFSCDDPDAKNVSFASTTTVTTTKEVMADLSSHISVESTTTIEVSGCSHDYEEVTEEHVDATCTKEGYTVIKCKECGEKHSVEIPMISHVFNKVVVDDQYLKSTATCTEKAVYYKSCVCGLASDTATFESGNPLGHSYGTPTYEWSQDKDGNWQCTATRVCVRDANHKETETIKGVHSVVTAATCTAAGEEKYTSTFTNTAFAQQVKSVAIPMIAHTFDREVVDAKYLKTAATCTSKAVYYKSCVCGLASDTATFESGNSLGHSYGTPTYEWTQDKDGNWQCTATRVCGHDANHKETETKTGVYAEVTPATYDNDGEAKSTATFTNTAFATQVKNIVIPKLSHVFDQQNTGSKYLNTTATCTEAATYFYSCECGEKGTATFSFGNPLGHNYDWKGICTRCGDNKNVQYLTIVDNVITDISDGLSLNVQIPDSIKAISSSAFEGLAENTSLYFNKDANTITGAPWGATNMMYVSWNAADYTYVDGELDCYYIYEYNQDGTTSKETYYNANGVPEYYDADFVYQDGNLKSYIEYSMDNVPQCKFENNENGRVAKETFYEGGEPSRIIEIAYSKENVILSESFYYVNEDTPYQIRKDYEWQNGWIISYSMYGSDGETKLNHTEFTIIKDHRYQSSYTVYNSDGTTINYKNVYEYDADGNQTLNARYDGNGVLRNKSVYKDGKLNVRFYYDSEGQLESYVGGYEFYENGSIHFEINYIYPNIAQYKSEYDENGELINRIFYENGNETYFVKCEYDAKGRAIKESYYHNGTDTPYREHIYTYVGDDWNCNSMARYENGIISWLENYENGYTAKRTYYENNVESYYVTFEHDANGRTTKESYYHIGETAPYETVKDIVYDSNGWRIKYTVYDANNKKIRHYEYEVKNNSRYQTLYVEYNSDSSEKSRIETAYDNNGNRTTRTRYENAEKSWTDFYDNDEIIKRIYYENDVEVSHVDYEHSDDGKTTIERGYSGDSKEPFEIQTYIYDDKGRIIEQKRESFIGEYSYHRKYEYDDNGRRYKYYDLDMTTEEITGYWQVLEYYNNGTTKTGTYYRKYNGSFVPSYTEVYNADGSRDMETYYDNNGNITHINKTIDWYPNGNDKVVERYNAGDVLIEILYYDEDWDLTKRTYYENGIESYYVTFEHDANGRTTKESHYHTGETTPYEVTEYLNYDSNGRCLEYKTYDGSSHILSYTKYVVIKDSRYQTLYVEYNADGSEKTRTENVYDDNGNRTSRTRYENGEISWKYVYEYTNGVMTKYYYYDSENILQWYYSDLTYYSDGTRKSETEYTPDGKKICDRQYDKDGYFVKEIEYENGIPVEIYTADFDENRNKIRESFFKYGSDKAYRIAENFVFDSNGFCLEYKEYDGDKNLQGYCKYKVINNSRYQTLYVGYNTDGSEKTKTQTAYDNNGNRTSRTRYDNGVLSWAEEYNEDGNIKKDIYYENGVETRYIVFEYTNGVRSRELYYYTGESQPYQIGGDFVFDEDGWCLSSTIYRADGTKENTRTNIVINNSSYISGRIVYNADGVTIKYRDAYLYDTDGNRTKYARYDGNDKLQWYYADITYYLDGTTKSETEYSADNVILRRNEYDTNGNCVKQTEYENGVEADYCIFEIGSNGRTSKEKWYHTGKTTPYEVIEYLNYDANGRCLEYKTYDGSSHLLSHTKYVVINNSRYQTLYVEYNADGTEKSRTETAYDSNGNCTTRTGYENGHKSWTDFYENGEIVKRIYYENDVEVSHIDYWHSPDGKTTIERGYSGDSKEPFEIQTYINDDEGRTIEHKRESFIGEYSYHRRFEYNEQGRQYKYCDLDMTTGEVTGYWEVSEYYNNGRVKIGTYYEKRNGSFVPSYKEVYNADGSRDMETYYDNNGNITHINKTIDWYPNGNDKVIERYNADNVLIEILYYGGEWNLEKIVTYDEEGKVAEYALYYSGKNSADYIEDLTGKSLLIPAWNLNNIPSENFVFQFLPNKKIAFAHIGQLKDGNYYLMNVDSDCDGSTSKSYGFTNTSSTIAKVSELDSLCSSNNKVAMFREGASSNTYIAAKIGDGFPYTVETRDIFQSGDDYSLVQKQGYTNIGQYTVYKVSAFDDSTVYIARLSELYNGNSGMRLVFFSSEDGVGQSIYYYNYVSGEDWTKTDTDTIEINSANTFKGSFKSRSYTRLGTEVEYSLYAIPFCGLNENTATTKTLYFDETDFEAPDEIKDKALLSIQKLVNYDAAGNYTGDVETIFNASGTKLASFTTTKSGNVLTTVEKDANDREGLTRVSQLNGNGKVTEELYKCGTKEILKREYTYDASGNLSNMTQTLMNKFWEQFFEDVSQIYEGDNNYGVDYDYTSNQDYVLEKDYYIDEGQRYDGSEIKVVKVPAGSGNKSIPVMLNRYNLTYSYNGGLAKSVSISDGNGKSFEYEVHTDGGYLKVVLEGDDCITIREYDATDQIFRTCSVYEDSIDSGISVENLSFSYVDYDALGISNLMFNTDKGFYDISYYEDSTIVLLDEYSGKIVMDFYNTTLDEAYYYGEGQIEYTQHSYLENGHLYQLTKNYDRIDGLVIWVYEKDFNEIKYEVYDLQGSKIFSIEAAEGNYLSFGDDSYPFEGCIYIIEYTIDGAQEVRVIGINKETLSPQFEIGDVDMEGEVDPNMVRVASNDGYYFSATWNGSYYVISYPKMLYDYNVANYGGNPDSGNPLWDYLDQLETDAVGFVAGLRSGNIDLPMPSYTMRFKHPYLTTDTSLIQNNCSTIYVMDMDCGCIASPNGNHLYYHGESGYIRDLNTDEPHDFTGETDRFYLGVRGEYPILMIPKDVWDNYYDTFPDGTWNDCLIKYFNYEYKINVDDGSGSPILTVEQLKSVLSTGYKASDFANYAYD